MRFISVNGVFYDLEKYDLKVSALKKIVSEEIENLLLKFGFVQENETTFYNKKLDLKLQVSIKRKSKLKFV